MNLSSLRSRGNLSFQISLLGRVIDYFLPIWILNTSICNIVEDGIVEQDTILRNNGNISSQISNPHSPDVLSIYQNLSSFDLVESVQESHDCRLSRPS